MAVVKIMGPPGTGKTYRLVNHYLKKELNTTLPILKKQYTLRLVELQQKKQQKEFQNYTQIKN